MNLNPSDEHMIAIFEQFKKVADEKKRVEDADLQRLFDTTLQSV